jgi:hypothetical protein
VIFIFCHLAAISFLDSLTLLTRADLHNLGDDLTHSRLLVWLASMRPRPALEPWCRDLPRARAGFWVPLPAGVFLAVAVAIFGTARAAPQVSLPHDPRPRHGRLGPRSSLGDDDRGTTEFTDSRPDLNLRGRSLIRSRFTILPAGFLITLDSPRIVRSPFPDLVGIREESHRTLSYRGCTTHRLHHRGSSAGLPGARAQYNSFVKPVDLQLAARQVRVVAAQPRNSLVRRWEPHRSSQEPRLGLHPSLASNPRCRLYRHNRLCPRRDRRSREAVGAAGNSRSVAF